jgi:hypothetical protein
LSAALPAWATLPELEKVLPAGTPHSYLVLTTRRWARHVERVEFDIEQDDRGPRAVGIVPMESAP